MDARSQQSVAQGIGIFRVLEDPERNGAPIRAGMRDDEVIAKSGPAQFAQAKFEGAARGRLRNHHPVDLGLFRNGCRRVGFGLVRQSSPGRRCEAGNEDQYAQCTTHSRGRHRRKRGTSRSGFVIHEDARRK